MTLFILILLGTLGTPNTAGREDTLKLKAKFQDYPTFDAGNLQIARSPFAPLTYAARADTLVRSDGKNLPGEFLTWDRGTGKPLSADRQAMYLDGNVVTKPPTGMQFTRDDARLEYRSAANGQFPIDSFSVPTGRSHFLIGQNAEGQIWALANAEGKYAIFDGSVWHELQLGEGYGFSPSVEFSPGYDAIAVSAGYFATANTASAAKKLALQNKRPKIVYWDKSRGVQMIEDASGPVEFTTKGIAYVRKDKQIDHIYIGNQEVAKSSRIRRETSYPSGPWSGSMITYEAENESMFIGRDGIIYKGKIGGYYKSNVPSESAALPLFELKTGGWWTYSTDAFGKSSIQQGGSSYPCAFNLLKESVIVYRAGRVPILASKGGPADIKDLNGGRLLQVTGTNANYDLWSISRSGSRMVWKFGRTLYYINSSSLKSQRINIPDGYFPEQISWDLNENLLLVLTSPSKLARLLTISEENQ